MPPRCYTERYDGPEQITLYAEWRNRVPRSLATGTTILERLWIESLGLLKNRQDQSRRTRKDLVRRKGPGPSCFSESAPSPLGFFEGHEESIKEPDLSSSSQNAMESWKTRSGRHTPTERQVASFHGVSISMCSNPEAPQEKVGAPTP